MNSFMIEERLQKLEQQLNNAEYAKIRRENDCLQAFVIWLKGFLDGNVSKRGEEK
jgi:hypothetical protein